MRATGACATPGCPLHERPLERRVLSGRVLSGRVLDERLLSGPELQLECPLQREAKPIDRPAVLGAGGQRPVERAGERALQLGAPALQRRDRLPAATHSAGRPLLPPPVPPPP